MNTTLPAATDRTTGAPGPTIPPVTVQQLLGTGKPVDLIDVRTPAEFGSLRAPGARLVPLDQLDPAAVLAGRTGPADQPIYLICKSGARAAKAQQRFALIGCQNAVCVEGGITAWEHAGLPVIRGDRQVISLERQVRIAAGLLVLAGAVLAHFVHPFFVAIPALIGAGLVFAGVTDWCGMAMMLAKMPWNRRAS